MRAVTVPCSLLFVFVLSATGCGNSADTGSPDSGFVVAGDAGAPSDDGGPDADVDAGSDGGQEDAGSPFPETTLTAAPPGASPFTSAELAFVSDDPLATFECSLDFLPYAACTSPVHLTGLQDGTHTFAVRARNAEGDVDPTPARAMWTVDTVPPETDIDSGPTPTTPGSTATFTFSANEAGAIFECAFDANGFAPCTSPFEIAAPLGTGTHTFWVRAVDAAGNIDPRPRRRPGAAGACCSA
ncbi:MAG: hypothetical protein IRZ16_06270 [Myxococcaceae bacterium]|nr:hypothetical protein [Myxococcaceae bacterium]